MNRRAPALLLIVIAAVMVACGDSGSRSDATWALPTEAPATEALDYEIISLDPPTAMADGGTPTQPEPTRTTPPLPTPSPFSTRIPEPTATPVITDSGEVIRRSWAVALLTVMDLPADVDWTREWMEILDAETATPEEAASCGSGNPMTTEAVVGVEFEEQSGRFDVDQMITEYVSPERAQQVLRELQTSVEALDDCEISDDNPDPSEFLRQRFDLVPVDLPAIGDDRIGYRLTITLTDPEFQRTFHVDWIVVQVDQFLMFVGFGDWESELEDVNVSLIERALQRLDIARAKPPAATSTVIPELDVSTIITCDQAAEEILQRIQVIIEIVAPVPLDQLYIAEEHPDADRLTDEVDALEIRARDIGCENSKFGPRVVRGFDNLVIAGPSALFVADLLRAQYME